MNALSDKYGIEKPKAKWLDLHKAVKKRFPVYRKQGGGLKAMAEFYGLNFDHHDAYSDALTTAKVFMQLIGELHAHSKNSA